MHDAFVLFPSPFLIPMLLIKYRRVPLAAEIETANAGSASRLLKLNGITGRREER